MILSEIVERWISRDINERKQLSFDQQSTLASAGLLYDSEPEEYVDQLKKPMAAHFANTTPPINAIVKPLLKGVSE